MAEKKPIVSDVRPKRIIICKEISAPGIPKEVLKKVIGLELRVVGPIFLPNRGDIVEKYLISVKEFTAAMLLKDAKTGAQFSWAWRYKGVIRIASCICKVVDDN